MVAQQSARVATSDGYVSVDRARVLIGRRGKPVARGTVLAAGLSGDLVIQKVAGRFVVTLASIDTFNAARPR